MPRLNGQRDPIPDLPVMMSKASCLEYTGSQESVASHKMKDKAFIKVIVFIFYLLYGHFEILHRLWNCLTKHSKFSLKKYLYIIYIYVYIYTLTYTYCTHKYTYTRIPPTLKKKVVYFLYYQQVAR